MLKSQHIGPKLQGLKHKVRYNRPLRVDVIDITPVGKQKKHVASSHTSKLRPDLNQGIPFIDTQATPPTHIDSESTAPIDFIITPLPSQPPTTVARSGDSEPELISIGDDDEEAINLDDEVGTSGDDDDDDEDLEDADDMTSSQLDNQFLSSSMLQPPSPEFPSTAAKNSAIFRKMPTLLVDSSIVDDMMVLSALAIVNHSTSSEDSSTLSSDDSSTAASGSESSLSSSPRPSSELVSSASSSQPSLPNRFVCLFVCLFLLACAIIACFHSLCQVKQLSNCLEL
jgi:hypothetical protein